MDRVPAAVAHQLALDPRAAEREISERIEKFVSYALIGESHSFWVENPLIRESENIFQRSPLSELLLFQFGDVFEKTKSARRGDFFAK